MMVDFVSLHDARNQKVTTIFEEESKLIEESGDKPTQTNLQTLQERIKRIPLNPVPTGSK